MKSYPTKFKNFLCKIVQMGTQQRLQNSIQTLILFWPVYPIHTNSLFWVIFEELPFCHFPSLNTSIRFEDSNLVDLLFEYPYGLRSAEISLARPPLSQEPITIIM